MENVAGGLDWIADTRATLERLLQQRRTCMQMENERLRDACMLSWRAQAIVEALRITNDLRSIAGNDVADQFFYDFLQCFNITPGPDDPTPREFAFRKNPQMMKINQK